MSCSMEMNKYIWIVSSQCLHCHPSCCSSIYKKSIASWLKSSISNHFTSFKHCVKICSRNIERVNLFMSCFFYGFIHSFLNMSYHFIIRTEILICLRFIIFNEVSASDPEVITNFCIFSTTKSHLWFYNSSKNWSIINVKIFSHIIKCIAWSIVLFQHYRRKPNINQL